MLGFHATANSAMPIRLDGELEQARWFAAAELGTAGASVLPPRYTIARRLIDSWYLGITGAALDAA
jgi:NADH pyrophosphatase NudC (nudix superfamily)